jgi:hypothetical protein
LSTWPIAPVGKFHHFAGHRVAQPVEAGDTVAHFQHLADLGHTRLRLVLTDLLAKHRRDFIHLNFMPPSPFLINPGNRFA